MTDFGLSKAEMGHLREIYRRTKQDSGAVETTLRDDRPLPDGGIKDLVARGWVKAGRGRCGPLGIYIGVYVVSLTEKGHVFAKLLFEDGS